MTRLGINVDHVATVRQARGEKFPDPVEAAKAAIAAGADGITAHLREDRRHIQENDLKKLRELSAPLNMEMSCAPEIVKFACALRPAWTCLVPEKRRELTTEGGLDVKREQKRVGEAIEKLKSRGARVSLFIDPSEEAVKISRRLGADAVELHTGTYARLHKSNRRALPAELKRLGAAAREAEQAGLLVNAGHGLDIGNVGGLMAVHRFHELNIGFAIVARAVFIGIGAAVAEMKIKLR